MHNLQRLVMDLFNDIVQNYNFIKQHQNTKYRYFIGVINIKYVNLECVFVLTHTIASRIHNKINNTKKSKIV